MNEVGAFLDGLGADERAAVERLCEIVRAVAPDVTEGTSYGMAAYRLRDKPLIGFTESRSHLSVHPFSAAAVDAVRADLPGFDVAKGTIRFTAQQPLPEAAVRALVAARMAEIDKTP